MITYIDIQNHCCCLTGNNNTIIIGPENSQIALFKLCGNTYLWTPSTKTINALLIVTPTILNIDGGVYLVDVGGHNTSWTFTSQPISIICSPLVKQCQYHRKGTWKTLLNADAHQIKMVLLVNTLTHNHTVEVCVWRCRNNYKCTHCDTVFETFSHWKTHVGMEVDDRHFMMACYDENDRPQLRKSEVIKRPNKRKRTDPFPNHKYTPSKKYLEDKTQSIYDARFKQLKDIVKYVVRMVVSINRRDIIMADFATDVLTDTKDALCGMQDVEMPNECIQSSTTDGYVKKQALIDIQHELFYSGRVYRRSTMNTLVKPRFSMFRNRSNNEVFKQSTRNILTMFNALDVLDIYGEALVVRLLKEYMDKKQ